MNGNKFLQILTLLLCAGILYFSYETYKEAKQIHEECQAVFATADSLIATPTTIDAAQSVVRTGSKAANLLDEIFSDIEENYHSSKKASAKAAKIRVSSSYRIEDRYVSFNIHDPELVGDEAGTIVIDITIDKSGNVKKTSVNPASTITNEDVIDAARKAALKTGFNSNYDGPEAQTGTITFTYTKK
ncbi:MAG: energy transducer TonB [Bacteroidales bacterium]|nr:energy transducer TonB [Candidatus Cacconaster merdequi]